MEKSVRFVSTAPNRTGRKRVMLHDPTIAVVDSVTGKDYDSTNPVGTPEYYVFGSYLVFAKSYDLENWKMQTDSEDDVELEGLGVHDQAVDSQGNPVNFGEGYNPLMGYVNQTLAEAFAWSGFDDFDSAGTYNVFANYPIWMEDYVWLNSDGSPTGETGAWLVYYSALSSYRRSCLGLVVSKTIDGPYDKPAYSNSVILYSGFTLNSVEQGVDRQATQAVLDQLESAGGWSALWNDETGTSFNSSYAPNVIDPGFVYDESGRLYMYYGSWSGGIWMLEIDKTTGLAIYPGVDSTTSDGRTIDRYYGIRLGLGNGASGEGAFITHDNESGYYYLYITYGGLFADGGYQMREFRSQSVDGPYYDPAGNKLEDFFVEGIHGEDNVNYGVKIMGNYIWESLAVAYMSGGQNSIYYDEAAKKWYNVYHTRFNDGSGSHEVRVHELFMNSDGWQVMTPYEYSSTDVTDGNYTVDDVAGSYQFINHGSAIEADILPTLSIQLNSDGSITGDITGTWSVSNGNKITIMIEGVTYQGIIAEQSDESAPNSADTNVMVLTAIGNNNQAVWGSKVS